MSITRTGKQNQYSGHCRNCGVLVEPGDGLLVRVSYYDWDNPDEDIAGSILQTRWDVECMSATDCARRVIDRGTNLSALRAIAADYDNLGDLAERAQAILVEWSRLYQQIAITDDLVARETGWGVIGGRHGG